MAPGTAPVTIKINWATSEARFTWKITVKPGCVCVCVCVCVDTMICMTKWSHPSYNHYMCSNTQMKCLSETPSAERHLYHNTTTVLRPFFRDHPSEPVPEENFWTSCCKGRLTEVDTLTIRLGTTPSKLSSVHLHHPPFFTGQMPFLPPNQQFQSTEGN